MTPTPKLRFVERESHYSNGKYFMQPRRVQILQQWWDNEYNSLPPGEWRDVPLEVEA
jgi:hypothetical protein